MKNIILAALFVAATGASAQQAAKVIKGAGDAAKAAQGGKAAISTTTQAVKAADIQAIFASVMTSTAPSADKIGQFNAYLDKFEGLNAQARESLVMAFQTNVLDSGCTDAGLTKEALVNLSKMVADVSKELQASGYTVQGLANVIKFSDLDGVNGIDANEQRLVDRAKAALNKAAAGVVRGYMAFVKKVDEKLARKTVNELSLECGLAPALGQAAPYVKL